MIIRVFRAKVQPGMHAEYDALLQNEAIPGLSDQPGLIALHVGTPIPQTPDEFVVITLWKDLKSLQDFAGDQWLESFVLPGEEHMVKESTVNCYTNLAFVPSVGDNVPS